MKHNLLILLIALGTQLNAQPHFTRGKTIKEIKKLNRIKEPGKAIADIEKLLPQLSDKSWRMRNLKIFLSLRLADLYQRTGDFQKSETQLTALVEEVSRLEVNWLKAMLPFYAGTIFDSYDHLAYQYLTMGNVKKAEEIFLQSQARRESVFLRKSVHRLLPLVGIGSLYFRKGEFEQTYQIFNEVEEKMHRATTTFYDYDNISRLYLNDLVEICLQQGRSEEAWKNINRLALASSGFTKFGSLLGSRLEIARIFELKARYFLLEGDYTKAQDYLNRANQYYSSRIISSDLRFKLLKTQALVYWFEGNIEKSDATFLALVKAYRQHIDANFMLMSEYEKEEFYNTLKSDFNLFNAYTLQLQSSKATRMYEAMLDNTLNTKAILLNQSNKIKNGIMQSGQTELISKLHAWENAKGQLSSFYFDKDGIRKIDSLERHIESLEKDLTSQSNLFTARENQRSWQQVKAILKKNEAAVEIIRINTVVDGNRRLYGKNSGLSDSAVYVALIIKPEIETPDIVLFANGQLMEKRYLSFYRNSIFSKNDDTESYDIFWRPLKQKLTGVNKVYLSPDGVFNQLNLNTLKNSATNQYLIDELELVYVTNTSDLLRERETETPAADAVLVGRPSYDFSTSSDPKQEPLTYGTRFVMTDELTSFKEQKFEDLPGTEAEIDRIEKTLKSRNIRVQTFKGDQALEENVKAVNNPGILHVATHGFFVEDVASAVNPMIRSGLILAGVKNAVASKNADGILTAYEATNLNLDRTSLVVLSACETGLGEVRNGEGVYGLQRAIIVAGASNLLMSLWKVDDEATAQLMISLYNNWQPGQNQQAFRDAQLSLRKSFPEPFYWGAFIMLGK